MPRPSSSVRARHAQACPSRSRLDDPTATLSRVPTPVDEVRRSRLGTALLASRLLTSDEVVAAATGDEGLAAWIRRQRLLPDALLAQAERGEPLRLGRYVVTGRLGKGGMGAVLRARDERLGRDVAIKVLRPLEGGSPADVEELRGRFRREALALARLDHPGVVRVFDLDEVPGAAGEPGLLLLVLELVVGRSVEERLRAEGPLPERDARRMLRQVAQAMSAAEARGIVHRDLKPGNVLWLPEGDLYKVCDFGLVRFEEGRPTPAPAGVITQACTVLGTPFYMSPEQALARPLDARSDMFSLGLALHEVLTGKVPFEGPKIDQVIRRRLHEDVPDVRRRAPHVSASLARVLGWMTQREAARRPPSWKALAAELAALDAGSGRLRQRRGESGERPRAAPPLGRAPARPTASVPVAALVVLALSLGAAVGALAALLDR